MQPKFEFDLSIPSVVAFADRMENLQPAEWRIYRFSMRLKPYNSLSTDDSDYIVDAMWRFFHTVCTLSGTPSDVVACLPVPQVIAWSDYFLPLKDESAFVNVIPVKGFIAVSAEWRFSDNLEDAVKSAGIWTHPLYNFEQMKIVTPGAEVRPVQAGVAEFLVSRRADISDDRASSVCHSF